MKRIPLLALLPAMAFSFAACNKDDGSKLRQVSFYTLESDQKLFLYLDGTAKGELPYSTPDPACGTPNGDGKLPLTFQLANGTYKIEGRDAQGTVLETGTVTLRKDGASSSVRMGSQRVATNDECVTIGVGVWK